MSWPRVGAQRVSRPTEARAACSSRSMAPDSKETPTKRARRPPVHSDQAREGVGGDGRRARSSSRGLEVRVDQGQSSVEAPLDVEIGQCRKYLSRAEKRIKELDAQREEESALLIEAQQRLERLVKPRAPSTESGDQVLSPLQMVNVLQSERDALAKEFHGVRGADDQDIRSTVKKQAVSRQVGSRREPWCPAPVMPPVRPERCDELVDRQSTRLHSAVGGRDNELMLHRASSVAPSVPQKFPHPIRQGARLQAMRSRAGHRRGLVVEVAPNAVDASAVVLPSSPHVITEVGVRLRCKRASV